MPRGYKTSILASAAIFILLEIAALALLDRSSTLQDIWINRAAHRTMAALWGGSEKLRSYFRLETVNEELVRQNAELNDELESYRSRLKAAEEACAAADLQLRPEERSAFSYTPATIVKMSRNRARNYVIVNKGSDDGVSPQSGIISGKGIVGIVNSVSRHYAYGLTVMNPDVTISTKVGKEGISAPLVWDGIHPDGAVVTDIPPHCTISPGDTVWTSGYSSIFPEGIAIGVTGASRLVDGSYQLGEVRLFQDFSSAHYVTITKNLDLGEIQSLEAGETEDGR